MSGSEHNAPVRMSEEAAGLTLVKAFYSAMKRGDVAAVLDLADEHVTVKQSAAYLWGVSSKVGRALSGSPPGREHISPLR